MIDNAPHTALASTGRPVAFARDIRQGATVVLGSGSLLTAAILTLMLAMSLRPSARALTEAQDILSFVHTWSHAHGVSPTGLDDVYGPDVPLDPWGNPWQLERRAGGIAIVSHGADGEPGGIDDNADIAVVDLVLDIGVSDSWYVST